MKVLEDYKLDKNNIGFLVQTVTNLNFDSKYRVNVEVWSDKRSLSANAQQHVWYKQIAEFNGLDIRTAGNMSKLDFGLPILLDSEYGKKVSFVLTKINFWNMAREQQINVMDLIQVTSLFKTKQHNLYRDNLQIYWYEQGLNLDYKD